MLGSLETGKFTDRAMKHIACASWCSAKRLRLSESAEMVISGLKTTEVNWPAAVRLFDHDSFCYVLIGGHNDASLRAQTRNQSLWQAEREATSKSSGFHRLLSPRNDGSEEPSNRRFSFRVDVIGTFIATVGTRAATRVAGPGYPNLISMLLADHIPSRSEMAFMAAFKASRYAAEGRGWVECGRIAQR